MKRTSAVIVATIVTLLFLPGLSSSEETYEFERMWPTLNQPWYFSEPRGIGRDLSGFIYVVDTLKCTIEKFSSDGFFVTRWGARGSVDGEFKNPRGIAIDAEGSVYIVDTENHRIQKFTADGTFVDKWGKNGGDGTSGNGSGEFWNPQSIATDTYGNVYVADFGQYDPQRGLMHRIQKFDSQWIYITEWEVYTAGDDRNPFIADIAVSSYDGLTHVYVVDKANHLIKKFDSVGNFITSWGGTGSGNEDFSEPNGIAIDQNGNVYVADMYNARIQKFTANGVYVTQWGEEGSGDGEFDFYPTGKIGIAIDSEGYICVGDHFRIQKFDINGTFLTKWSSLGSDDRHFNRPGGLAIDLHDYIYVVDSNNNCIKKFDAEGNHLNFSDTITNLGICDDIGGLGDGEFNLPTGMTIDSDGYIYVADAGNHRVQKFYPDGTFYKKWESEGISDIAIDTEGYVYVSDQLNHRIQKFDLEGNYFTEWGGAGSDEGQFNFPHGITVFTVNDSTYVYVADSLNHRVQKFSSNGDYITEWGAEVSVDGEFRQPVGIAADAEGYIYVTESSVDIFSHEGINRVQKFRDNGTSIESVGAWGTTGPNPGQLDAPYDLAVHSNGKVYVVETINNRVQVFTPVTTDDNPKAIIVAGRASPEDSLWDATQVCTNFAHRALTHQGFTKDDIYYLTPDTDLDLDRNGVADDVAAFPDKTNLQSAITEWATADGGADHLIVYLNDHGGPDTFRLHESREEDDGLLRSETLKDWLDAFQESTSGKVTVIYEACESGSFVNDLQGHDRIIITSAQVGEQAKFLNQGTISFSLFLWTNIFNGFSLDDSFANAKQAVNSILSDQTPQISGDAKDVYIGKRIEGVIGESPQIDRDSIEISELQERNGVPSVDIYATVSSDPDGIARVWAEVWPPDYIPETSQNPLLALPLPSVELLPVDETRYKGTFNKFTHRGVYQIAIYAMDRNNTISQPQFTSISYHITRRAIIVAGGAEAGLMPTVEANARLAYSTLDTQGYRSEEIYSTGFSGFPKPSRLSLGDYLERLAASDFEYLDLLIYFIGEGYAETFIMNSEGDEDSFLPASQLAVWLDFIQDQNQKSCRVTLIYDANYAGSFIESLASSEKERIIIASTGRDEEAYFNEEGDICFSMFFWDQLATGATAYKAFAYAKEGISYCIRKKDISFSCYKPQSPLLEANGNGLANEMADYRIAMGFAIGKGMKFAADPPQIGSASVERNGDTITIIAENVTSTSPLEKVWAVIQSISYCPGSSEGETPQPTEKELDHIGDGKYEGTIPYPGACKVTVYAMSDDNGKPNISLPVETKVYQEGGDIYEPDDTFLQANVIVVNYPTPQPHTFHHIEDVDWVKFYGVAGQEYTIEASNLGKNCPVIELYHEDDLTTPIAVSELPVDDKVWLDFSYTEGIYFVGLWGECGGEDTSYDLKVYDGNMGLTSIVAGKVKDADSGNTIDGAVIRSTGVGHTISTHGEYLLSEIPGNWSMTAEKNGYETAWTAIRIESTDQYIREDIAMRPLDKPACITDADCDDGLFCNGMESCSADTCQPGTGLCAEDGLFCNGGESCNEENDTCEHSGSPCPGHLSCVEENNQCVENQCTTDADCNDGLHCNGTETCGGGICQMGSNPCSEPTLECNEENDLCVEGATIQLLPNPCLQSRWIPLLMFLRIIGVNTHFDTSSRVTFNPPGAVLALPILGDSKHIFTIGFMMPGWFRSVDSVNVTVTTGSEEVSGVLTIELLPFLLNEHKVK
jgi:sugar lactone lactonase YvrE